MYVHKHACVCVGEGQVCRHVHVCSQASFPDVIPRPHSEASLPGLIPRPSSQAPENEATSFPGLIPRSHSQASFPGLLYPSLTLCRICICTYLQVCVQMHAPTYRVYNYNLFN